MTNETFLRIRDILVEKAAKDPSMIHVETKLEDLGIDSFDFIEFVFFVEDAFGIQIDVNYNDIGSRLKTVGDVAKAVDDLLAAKRMKTLGSDAA